ncbi:MAG: restriction endonuclease subunit R, partial [Candidatus Dadabacteria bacterium]|nr:restriction endonuclease subunit R [Candidatus Dadabacteria bacterium]
IEIHSVTDLDWQHTLTAAKEKLNNLEKEAGQLKSRENRHIRPIALVRVQRTGKEQREQGYIHAEDAKDYLIRNLKVPEEHIRIQSSEKKELAGEDLMSEMSNVRWIITKDALKEGWDCSFAYILALLDNTTARTAITQMVGRVMRQPHARSVDKNGPLNRCFIYCCNVDVQKAVEWVRTGLENEGLTGLGGSVVSEGETGAGAVTRTINRRAAYKKLDIFLPQVLHKDGAKWRPIDYDRDILGALDWGSIDTGRAVNFSNTGMMAEIKAVVDLKGDKPPVSESEIDTGETLTQDYFVRRLIDTVPNPWQAARITGQFLTKHSKYDDAKLLKNRVFLSEVLRQRVRDEVDRKAEQCFRDKLEADEIKFHLVTDK